MSQDPGWPNANPVPHGTQWLVNSLHKALSSSHEPGGATGSALWPPDLSLGVGAGKGAGPLAFGLAQSRCAEKPAPGCGHQVSRNTGLHSTLFPELPVPTLQWIHYRSGSNSRGVEISWVGRWHHWQVALQLLLLSEERSWRRDPFFT